MSIVYMKALEAEPSKFDKAFQKLSPAVNRAYNHVLETIRAIQKEEPLHILEIGSGTGHLSRQITRDFDCAYTGIDISPAMVDYAESMKSSEESRVEFMADDFLHMDLQRLETQEFDIIVSTFTLSELRTVEKRLFLQRIRQLLAMDGIAVLADETVPQGLRRATFGLKHFIYAQLALLKVGKTTYPLKALPQQFQEEGLKIVSQKKLTGNVQAWNLRKEDEAPGSPVGPLRAALGKLVWLKVGYTALNGVMTRRAVKPGLYSVGSPDTTSPVIITANYYWTVARVSKRLLQQKANLWVLVIDTAGINVWCGAGGGYFTAERVLNALEAFRVRQQVGHKAIILPQLCATGVDHQLLRKQGWKVQWGPVDIKNLPTYLENNMTATPDERLAKFPIGFRLILGAQHALFFAFYLLFGGLLALIASIFFREQGAFWLNVLLVLILLSILFSLVWSALLFIFPLKSYFQNAVLFGMLAGAIAGAWFIVEAPDLNMETVIFWSLATAMIALLTALDFAGHTQFTAVTQFEADLTSGGVFVLIGFLILLLIGLTGQVEHVSIALS